MAGSNAQRALDALDGRDVATGPPADPETARRLEIVAANLGATLASLEGLLSDVWGEIRDNPEAVRVLAETKVAARKKYKGQVPPFWEEVAECPACGPVYVPPGAQWLATVGCPWCPVRARLGAVPAAARAAKASEGE